MKKLILIFLFTPTFLFSQKEYNYWVIGNEISMDFNSIDDKPKFEFNYFLFPWTYDLNSHPDILSPSSVCDSLGNLRYFSVGNRLCDINNNLVVPINELKGGIDIYSENPEEEWDFDLHTSVQNSILLSFNETIIRLVNHNQEYYYNFNMKELYYDKIDQSNRVSINNLINENYRSNSMFAIKNFTNENYWLIGYDDKSQTYLCYLVDSNGVDNVLHDVYQLKKENKSVKYISKSIKASPNGQIIVNAIHGVKDDKFFDTFYELIEFDPLVGKFITDNSKQIKSFPIAFEFSANSRYLYLSLGNDIKQVDLYSNNESQLALTSSRADMMQLGPNNKIYYLTYKGMLHGVPEYNPGYLFPMYEINNGNYTTDKIKISKLYNSGEIKAYVWGFPNIPTSQYLRVYTKSKFEVCEGEAVQLESFVVYPQGDTTYSWSGPNGFTSTEQNPLLENLTPADEGVYTVTVSGGEEPYTAETFVRVFPSPEPELIARPRTFLCTGDGIFLNTKADYTSYRWTTGDTTQAIRVTKSGTYGVTVTSENGCEGYAEIKVGFAKDFEIAITGDTAKCIGESVTLTSADEYEEYEWSTGETSRSITVVQPGYYTLTVLTEEGCEVSRTIQVKDHAPVDAELMPTPTTICEGDSTLLEAKYYSPYYIFEWNTGATTRGIYASETGTYKLRITDTRTGCSDSTEIAIKLEDNLEPTITRSNICSGASAILEVLPNDPSYSYEWSNGATTPVIEVSQAGTYTVTVSKAGCSGTAEFTVEESPSPEFEILGERIICNNETATLTADKDFEEYLWSTNEITKSIEVNQAGTYTLTVTDENGCSATKSFKVEKYELNFTISNSNIDFGKVYISETKTDRATLTNNSGFAITLENGEKVQNGQTYEINYDFTPSELGFFGDDISIHIIEPCDTTVVIPITARVYARATISTDDIYTEIGRTETVPVYLECEADLPTETYEITTDIDKSVFFTSDSYIVSQNQPIIKARTKIHELTGTVLLSDALVYDIAFPSYKFDNTYIEVTDKPGKIFIDSICVFNYRNIAFTEPTTLTATPTPATEQLNINITTGMQGTMHLELVSTDGRVIYTNEWHQTTRSKQFQLDTRAIPSGLYQLRLITPYDAITTSVVVVE